MKKLGILAVYLFGSEAEGATTIRSDIDIGVVLKDPKNLEDTRPLYNTIYPGRMPPCEPRKRPKVLRGEPSR